MGSYVLWEDAICIRKHLQGNKLSSSSLFKIACGLYKDHRFDWIGGRTQNPLVILRYARLGTLFPFDQLYEGKEGSLLMKYLQENISEVREVRSRLGPATGICREVYPEGKLGDFALELREALRFEGLLSHGIWP